jgi:hypothetical protein
MTNVLLSIPYIMRAMYISTLPFHYLNLFSLPTSGAEIYIGQLQVYYKGILLLDLYDLY